MTWVSAKYNYMGDIDAIDDEGRYSNIPANPDNRDYLVIMGLGIPIAPYEGPIVPLQSLTPRQIRLALFSVGITEGMVDSALVGNDVGIIEWKYASSFNRNNPLITALGPAFNLDEEQIDTLWVNAMTL